MPPALVRPLAISIWPSGKPGHGARSAISPRALAVLHGALLTKACLDALKGEGASGKVVLDGSFLNDPLYAPLVAGLRAGDTIFTSAEPNGTAIGAALLAHHGIAAPCTLAPVSPLAMPGLAEYAADWAARAAAAL